MALKNNLCFAVVGFASSLVLAPPGSAVAKDLGMFDGEPSPALAMYAAQVNFAESECVLDGYIQDGKDIRRFVKYFNNGTQLHHYRAKAADFASSFDAALATYRSAWQHAGQNLRAEFCGGLQADIAEKKSMGFFRWAVVIGYFRSKFSPISKESAERKRKIGRVMSVIGTVATTAATISAGSDAVSSAKAGDWTASNQEMAASRGFNQAGGALVSSLASTTAATVAGPLVSVFEETMPGGANRIVRCPVVDHFSNYSAPKGSLIWLTYQSVSVACRDPVASDVLTAQ